MDSPELTISVLHYNRWDLTKDCLASIDAQEIPCAYEKVLVDNGSTEDCQYVIPSGWRVVRCEDNQGHIVGQNRCFESARGEWVLFVANDIRLLPGVISHFWTMRNSLWITQPSLLTRTGTVDNRGLFWWWPGYGISYRQQTWKKLDAVSGSCYFIPKDIWTYLGGFDETLFTSHEDVDFCLRAGKKGYFCQASPAQAVHLGNATLCHQPSHTRTAFHQDRIYVIKKHYRGVNRLLRLAAVCLLDSFPHL